LAAVDHLQQAAAAVVVFLVGLEVLGQVRDACAEQSHLHFRRAGIVVAAFVFVDDALVVDGHDVLLKIDARKADAKPDKGCEPPDSPSGDCNQDWL